MTTYALTVLRGQFQFAQEWLTSTMEEVTPEVAAWLPPGLATPISAQYAHTLTSADLLVLVAAAGSEPLMASSYAGRTGFSLAPEGEWYEWGRSLEIDLEAAHAYGRAVFQAIDDYLATLTDEALFETVDGREYGLDIIPRWDVLSLALLDLHVHSGEIAALKGLQGLRGYPL